MLRVISLTVVLPQLPVNAITGKSSCCRCQAPICPNAIRVSATRIVGIDAVTLWSTRAAIAPLFIACSRNLCPSKFSPLRGL